MPEPSDSVFLRLAKNRKVDPSAEYIIHRLKSMIGEWDQEPDDFSDEEAFLVLRDKEWINLQAGYSSEKTKIKDIEVLADFPKLTGLCLWDNEIQSIAPLENLTRLERLGLRGNKIEDLTPIRRMTRLKELEVHGNPIRDLSVLAGLPGLEELEISGNQLNDQMASCTLPAVRSLKVHELSGDLRFLPMLPDLRGLIVYDCTSLAGIERFTELRNLSVSGTVEDLSPLSGLRKLTHLSVGHNRVTSLAPLSHLFALRDIWAGKNQITSVRPLARLPVLHRVELKENPLSESEMAALQSYLTPWSDEFADPNPTTQPSLAIKVVSQEVWDYYDTHPFNVDDVDDDDMLDSEKRWLSDQIEEALAVDWKKDEDFCLPWKSPRARSFTVFLSSEEAASELRSIATTIQRALCGARHEYIVYLETDSVNDIAPEYIVWVYRDHLLVTPKDEPMIVKLLSR